MSQEVVSVQTGEVMEQHWGDVDIQIATAKRYPRSIKAFIERATTMATITPEVAKSCFYALPRKENGQNKMIKGPSARLAEIVASAWGHLRVEGRTVSDDNQFVTSRGVAWDLEANVAIAFEARRRITTKEGRRFNDDMIAVTANAATSIALRNAIFKTVPSSYWRPIYEQCLKVSVGDAKSIYVRRKDAIAHFGALGIPLERVLALLEKQAIEDVDASDIETLFGLATAIKDGDTTLDEAFPAPAIQQPKKKEPAESKQAVDASQQATDASKPAESATKPAAGEPLHGEAAGQSLVDALDDPKPEAKPEPAKVEPVAYDPQATYRLTEIREPAGKDYVLLVTAEGFVAHSFRKQDKLAVANAKAAHADGLLVRIAAVASTWQKVPWRAMRVEPVEEREVGQEG